MIPLELAIYLGLGILVNLLILVLSEVELSDTAALAFLLTTLVWPLWVFALAIGVLTRERKP